MDARRVFVRLNRPVVMRLFSIGVLLVMTFALAVAPAGAADDDNDPVAVAGIIDEDGDPIGIATFVQEDDYVTVRVNVFDLPEGYFSVRLHEHGVCEPPDFKSAGDLLLDSWYVHPGDYSVLLVDDNGEGSTAFRTYRFNLEDLLDDEGTAIVIHDLRDFFDHDPDRYGGPDNDGWKERDMGDRVGCGVVSPLSDIEWPTGED